MAVELGQAFGKLPLEVLEADAENLRLLTIAGMGAEAKE